MKFEIELDDAEIIKRITAVANSGIASLFVEGSSYGSAKTGDMRRAINDEVRRQLMAVDLAGMVAESLTRQIGPLVDDAVAGAVKSALKRGSLDLISRLTAEIGKQQ